MDPNNPLGDMFHTIASMAAARSAAASLAALQAHFFKQLEAEGVHTEVAERLVVETTKSLLEAIAGVTGAVAENADKIAVAFQALLPEEK